MTSLSNSVRGDRTRAPDPVDLVMVQTVPGFGGPVKPFLIRVNLRLNRLF
jgi:hypothetical protein